MCGDLCAEGLALRLPGELPDDDQVGGVKWCTALLWLKHISMQEHGMLFPNACIPSAT